MLPRGLRARYRWAGPAGAEVVQWPVGPVLVGRVDETTVGEVKYLVVLPGHDDDGDDDDNVDDDDNNNVYVDDDDNDDDDDNINVDVDDDDNDDDHDNVDDDIKHLALAGWGRRRGGMTGRKAVEGACFPPWGGGRQGWSPVT